MTPRAPADPDELVGRGAEIGLLQSFVDRAGHRGEALVLVGDAGVGKTALLDFAARRAGSLGFAVVRAAGAGSRPRSASRRCTSRCCRCWTGSRSCARCTAMPSQSRWGSARAGPLTGWLSRAPRWSSYGGQVRSSRC